MAEKKETAKVKRPTALKRDMQSVKRQMRNRSMKARIGTAVRSFEKELKGNDQALTQEKWTDLQSLLDKSAKKGVFKLNKVSRLKAKFASKLA